MKANWLAAMALGVFGFALGSIEPAISEEPKIAKTSGDATAADLASLTVIDETGKSQLVSAAEIAKLPRRSVKTKNNSNEVEFEGVSLVDLLKSVGVTFGHELRRSRAANIVLCEAKDGYRVALSHLEIDPDTTDKLVIIADHRGGKPLADPEGPYRLVIPDEKRPVRWIRMLRTIRVMNLKDLPLDTAPKPAPQSTSPQ